MYGKPRNGKTLKGKPAGVATAKAGKSRRTGTHVHGAAAPGRRKLSGLIAATSESLTTGSARMNPLNHGCRARSPGEDEPAFRFHHLRFLRGVKREKVPNFLTVPLDTT
jgi:hypothetical protein